LRIGSVSLVLFSLVSLSVEHEEKKKWYRALKM